jgi:tetratricopeptide (TPR) repeat protein
VTPILLLAGLTAFGWAAAQRAPVVTFNKDIAPIVFTHCSPCHRTGAVGPFDLLTYRDVRQRATQVATVTARRIMPPWKPTGSAFLDHRALTERQIQLFQDWVAQGSAEGEARDLPPTPAWPTDVWQLGTPDLIVQMPEPYVVPADGQDMFRTFVIPIPLKTARYVAGLEFRPGNPRAVHHANLGIDRTSSSRRLDERDPAPGYFGGILPDANYPPGQMLGWTPGQRPRPAPAGTQWRLNPGDDLVVQLHMQPTGKNEPVQASVGLFLTDEPPVRTPVGLRLGSETIDIAAGDRQYVVADSYVLPADVEVLAIQPHAHNLARQIEAVATLPDLTKRALITITDWDFRWQEVYRYAQPVALPKGTTIAMRYTYDNSASNARNPHAPPQRVVWGQNTSNEMGDLWVQVVPRTAGDLPLLNSDIGRKMRAEDIRANIKLLEADPSNSTRHDTVAVLYLQDGQSARAVPYLRESLRLRPGFAPAHYNLGLALTSVRQFEEAFREYSEAIRLDQGHADAHNSLGALLHSQGKLDEAIGHYRRAATLRPDSVNAHGNLGQALFVQGHIPEALAEFREALRLNPDFPPALTGLAWIMATSADAGLRNPNEAIRLAERGAALTGQSEASALDALAAAYAAAGRFDRAIAVARSAADLAATAGRPELAAQIRQRQALYEKGTPFRRP